MAEYLVSVDSCICRANFLTFKNFRNFCLANLPLPVSKKDYAYKLFYCMVFFSRFYSPVTCKSIIHPRMDWENDRVIMPRSSTLVTTDVKDEKEDEDAMKDEAV